MNMWFLICISVLVLFGLVLIFALVRGTRKVRDRLEDQTVEGVKEADPGEINTRWARADTVHAPDSPRKPQGTLNCPSCGGENPGGASTCVYCGRKL